MAQQWQTIEEAAVSLKISTRTLHRRIAAGEYETRLENGRREVQVEVAEPQPAAVTVETSETSRATAAGNGQPTTASQQSPSTQADATAQPKPEVQTFTDGMGKTQSGRIPSEDDTALAIAEDRIRRTEIALAAYQMSMKTTETQLKQVRTSAVAAWSTVGVLVVAVLLATSWSVWRVTRSETQVETLAEQLNSAKETSATWRGQVQSSQNELEKWRQQATKSEANAARAIGELDAMRAYARMSLDPDVQLVPVPEPVQDPAPANKQSTADISLEPAGGL